MGDEEMQKQTYRKADVQTDEAMEGEFDGQAIRQTDRWTDGKTYGRTDKQTPERRFTQVGSGLTLKYHTKL